MRPKPKVRGQGSRPESKASFFSGLELKMIKQETDCKLIEVGKFVRNNLYESWRYFYLTGEGKPEYVHERLSFHD